MLYTETVKGTTLELLKKLEAESIMSEFSLAGGTSNIIIPFKAITYFDDIDFDEDIVVLNGKYDWNLIESRLIDMAKGQDKIFDSFPLL